MHKRPHDLDWRDVEVVDEDSPRSAAGTVTLAGFERVAAEVGLGEVGAVRFLRQLDYLCGRMLSSRRVQHRQLDRGILMSSQACRSLLANSTLRRCTSGRPACFHLLQCGHDLRLSVLPLLISFSLSLATNRNPFRTV
jgi:hypothetical protein